MLCFLKHGVASVQQSLICIYDKHSKINYESSFNECEKNPSEVVLVGSLHKAASQKCT